VRCGGAHLLLERILGLRNRRFHRPLPLSVCLAHQLAYGVRVLLLQRLDLLRMLHLNGLLRGL
jgi:hypothetical protein